MLIAPTRQLVIPRPKPFRQRLRDLLNPIWVNTDGEPLVDGLGAPIDCADCPCDWHCSNCEHVSDPCSACGGCTPTDITLTFSGTGGSTCCVDSSGSPTRSYELTGVDFDGTFVLPYHSNFLSGGIRYCRWRLFDSSGIAGTTGNIEEFGSLGCTGSSLSNTAAICEMIVMVIGFNPTRAVDVYVASSGSPVSIAYFYERFDTGRADCNIQVSGSNDLTGDCEEEGGTFPSLPYASPDYLANNVGSVTVESCDVT